MWGVLLAHDTASLVTLKWIMGHVDETSAVEERKRRDARGNSAADATAKEGRVRHHAAPQWLEAKVCGDVADVQAVVLVAAEVLPLWPRASKEELKVARPRRPATLRKAAELPHDWACLDGRWRRFRMIYRWCLSAAFSHNAIRRRAGEECTGNAQSIKGVVADGRVHSLMVADVDGFRA